MATEAPTKQCAAVRTARGATTVPEQYPRDFSSSSSRLINTTELFVFEHAVPLTIEVLNAVV
jgi:hypothetical protein